MKSSVIRYLSLFFLSSSFSRAVFAEEFEYQTVYPMRAAVRHIEPGGIGYNQGYTTLEAFISPTRSLGDGWIPFLDLRGHVFDNGEPAVNVGVGARYLASSWVWGANVYYDYRETSKQQYNQIAAGLEALGEVLDFRINGYIPLGKTTSDFWGASFAYFQDHFAILLGKHEFALKGANAEVAVHRNIREKNEVTIAAGPYYLTGNGESTWGGEGRIAVDLFDYFRVQGSASYDSIFHWVGQGQLSIVIPFGGKRVVQKKSCQSCSKAVALATRSIQPVERFEIIPVDRKKARAKAINPCTGDPYIFWFVNNTSNSLGTFESPFPTLIQAQNASGPGDVIYVFPGDGTSTGMDEGIVLKNDQWLFGAGITQTLPTTTRTIVIPPHATGFPSVTAATGNSVVTVASNNTISGFQIATDANGVVNGSYCIGSLSGRTVNLFIANNTLTANNGAIGIIPNQPSGRVTITNNTIQSADTQGTYGIYLSETGGTGAYNITNNLISNFQRIAIFPPSVPSGTGMAILVQNQSNVTAAVSGNQILGCSGHGIDFHVFGTGSPTLFATIEGNQLEGIVQNGMGTFILSDDDAAVTFQVLNNQTSVFAFGFIAQAEGNSFMTGLIQNNVFTDGAFGSGVIVQTNLLTQAGAATGIFNIISNDISSYGDAQGIATGAHGSSSMTASIEKNAIYNIGRAGVFMQGFDSSNNHLAVLNNIIIGNNGGMEVDAFGTANVGLFMQGNSVTYNNGAGLFSEPSENSNVRYEILGNTFVGNNILNLNTGSALTILPQDAANTCLRMENNQSIDEATQPDYDLENMSTGQFSIEPLVGNTGTFNQSGTTPVPSGFCGSSAP